MKKLLGMLLASALVLGACGNDEKEKKEEPKKESKTKDKTEKKKVSQEKEQKINESEKVNKTTSIDFSNITDRSTLEQVLYGNYSEEQKIQAYNSAVANGVIPQGNVTEGSALSAYQSSLRVENGDEQSIYNQASLGTDAGMIDYDEYNRIVEAENQAREQKEAALQKEYFELSDKMYQDGVSDEAYNAMEKRQNEILDQIQPIN